MGEKLFVLPEYVTAKEIKAVRKKTGLTQKEFAQLVNVSKSTVERWERSEEYITGAIVTLLGMLDKYPDYAKEVRIPEKIYPLRLWYMYKQKI